MQHIFQGETRWAGRDAGSGCPMRASLRHRVWDRWAPQKPAEQFLHFAHSTAVPSLKTTGTRRKVSRQRLRKIAWTGASLAYGPPCCRVESEGPPRAFHGGYRPKVSCERAAVAKLLAVALHPLDHRRAECRARHLCCTLHQPGEVVRDYLVENCFLEARRDQRR